MDCLQCFSSKEVLTNHDEVCLQLNGKQGSEMPEKGSNVQFSAMIKNCKYLL